MRTRSQFDIAAGTIRGAEHARVERPNQDAVAWRQSGSDGAAVVAAVVTDGCGSGRHSEVGARLGAALWADALCRWALELSSVADPALYRVVRRDVIAQLESLVEAMGGDRREVIAEHFLFTVVGCVVAGGLAAIHAVGDGAYAIDGDVVDLGPFPGNEPPYIGYDLTGGPGAPVRIAAVTPVDEIESIALATDGALELEPLAELCREPRYTRNRDAIRRRLALINRPVVEPDWEARRLVTRSGPLSDDTTVLVMRRSAPRSEP